ncbi:hydrolase [Actinosynnema sp. ALI-1.44]|uniref:amidohydrolase n=1 Tax=Actinosynnema sp. ALI-1.44 TaxID=1933779 RepID=UPI00097C5B2C|nr:amidohydrolase [Actinosynnema sp. ALI-1.44]ONI75043.1 hydrolase [Actinosynnema sp. ALI-1.44]
MIEADLVLKNADVVTLDGPDASAVAILGDRIVALAEVPAKRVIDLDGATVTPGFHDAHNHMSWYGLTLSEVDVRVTSLDSLYAAIATAPDDDEWIIASGYDENKCGGHPTRDGLDRAARGRKVLVKHTSGHMCVVNSPVLRELGIDEHAVEVDGGLVVTDSAGRPTGLLQEQAQQLVNPLILPYPVDTLVDAIDRAGRRYLAEGITSCVEAGIGGGWIGKSPVELEAYHRAREQGKLHVRVELMIAADVLHPVAELGVGLDLGIRTGFGDDWLSIGPVKVFSDGSLIGHTAAMCHEFADTPGNRGYLQGDADALTSTILAAHRAGWRVATHAIGDAAIDLVLDAYATAGDPARRHRIEHFGVARPDQVLRARDLGVVPVPQGRFANEIGDGMLRALGPERSAWAYRQRSLLDAGIVVPGSSDRPVVTGAPLLGMHDMVNQRTASGAPFNPGEAVTGLEALRAFTYGSAYASKQEHRKGTITVGKLADLVVLSDSPARVDPSRIKDIEVLRTMVGGEFR